MESLARYLKQLYQSETIELVEGKRLPVEPYLQDNYGEANDCTLVSIASVLHYYHMGQVDELYPKVEKVAKQYFYNGNTCGTLPIFIRKIFQIVAGRKVKSSYFKSIGYSFNQIQKQIDYGNPVILNLMDDGVGKYKNHSVVVIGYTVHKLDNDKYVFTLLINDNWSKETQWIVYNKLSTISSIVYLR